ncbi:Dph6-related ATP pyrophosphatase [Zobellia nedashkovskayae]
MKKLKTYFNWSTGKDAALAYYHLQKDDRYQVDQFVTSINTHHNRVSMHGLRRELLLKQVQEIGLPVTTMELPEEPTMEEYNAQMEQVVTKLKSDGYSHCGFGDIFLEDLRAYREEQLKKI